MRRLVVPALVLMAALSGGGAVRAADDEPAVARPSFASGGVASSPGLVFFIPARSRAGVAAVGTAHNADLAKLVAEERVDFALGRSRRVVAASTGLLVPPGQAFNAPGSSLSQDFTLYALDAAPAGARVLQLDSRKLHAGERVRVVGIPADGARDEDGVFGKVAAASPTRIEIDLDVAYDLRGWGGAPVLSQSGHVVGILQAYWPKGDTARVIAAPIRDLEDAAKSTLEGGAGRPFAAFQNTIAQRERAANAQADRARGAGSPAAAKASAKLDPLIRQGRRDETRIHLDVQYPPDGAVISDSICGAFVSGRALALQGELRRFDVMLVLDTSFSTEAMTGADINGNGVVGKPRLGSVGSILLGNTDSGDSILAAEVAAARQLLRGLDPRSTRVGVVTFAGQPPGSGQGGLFGRPPPPPAVTLEPLTADYARVEIALDAILGSSPAGSTHMAAGVDQATIELKGLRGALSKADPGSEKVVFFFTDGQPTLPYGPGFEADNVRSVLRAANRASRGGIRIHSFAIGPDALDGPIAVVEMATRTDGYFTPVRHPGDLVDVVEEVSFANLDDIQLKSLTTGKPAHPFRSTADGSWGGFVQMEPGRNEIEVYARADDGTEARRTVAVQYVAEGPPPSIPAEMVVQRNRLLEDCLRDIKRLRMEAEKEHAEEVRKELMVEIEEERARARERAQEQRKSLEIGVEEDETP